MKSSGKIKYWSGYKYQLSEDWWCQTPLLGQAARIENPTNALCPFVKLDNDGVLHISTGYSWDGPSGPAIDSPNFLRGSLAHDALYQLMRERKLPQETRKIADDVLIELCKDDGMCRVRRWWVYRALRRFAAFAARPKDAKPNEAP